MAKRKTILGIPKCGQPTSCAPSAPLGCSTQENPIRRAIVFYLSNFLAGQRGLSAPVTDNDRNQATEMADEILAMPGVENPSRQDQAARKEP